MKLRIIGTIEEQVAVQFTGKVNVLARYNRQYLGHFLFKDGEVIQAVFRGSQGLKAFYQIIIAEFMEDEYDYVVEPEVVEESQRQIHYPYSVIKNKLADVLKLHRESQKLRPPANVKIIIDSSFIEETLPISPEEFSVLEALTEWNSPLDVYQHCDLLEHEITWALVSLRKKNALKIISSRNNG